MTIAEILALLQKLKENQFTPGAETRDLIRLNAKIGLQKNKDLVANRTDCCKNKLLSSLLTEKESEELPIAEIETALRKLESDAQTAQTQLAETTAQLTTCQTSLASLQTKFDKATTLALSEQMRLIQRADELEESLRVCQARPQVDPNAPEPEAIQELQTQITNLNAHIVSLQNRLTLQDTSLADCRQQLKESTEEATTTSTQLNTLRTEKQAIQTQLAAAQSKVTDLERQLDEMRVPVINTAAFVRCAMRIFQDSFDGFLHCIGIDNPALINPRNLDQDKYGYDQFKLVGGSQSPDEPTFWKSMVYFIYYRGTTDYRLNTANFIKWFCRNIVSFRNYLSDTSEHTQSNGLVRNVRGSSATYTYRVNVSSSRDNSAVGDKYMLGARRLKFEKDDQGVITSSYVEPEEYIMKSLYQNLMELCTQTVDIKFREVAPEHDVLESQQYKDLKGRYDLLAQALEELRRENLQQQVDECKAERDALKTERDNLTTQLATLRQQLTTSQTQLQQAQTTREQLRQSTNNLNICNTNLDSFRNENKRLTEENTSLKNQSNLYRDEAAKLRTELEETKKNYQECADDSHVFAAQIEEKDTKIAELEAFGTKNPKTAPANYQGIGGVSAGINFYNLFINYYGLGENLIGAINDYKNRVRSRATTILHMGQYYNFMIDTTLQTFGDKITQGEKNYISKMKLSNALLTNIRQKRETEDDLET